jgi:hypothetical protein
VRDVDERIEEPAAEQPRARRRDRIVDDVEQGALCLTADQRLDELEVRDRRFVEHDAVALRVERKPCDRQRARGLRGARVRDDGRSRA